MLEDPSVTPGAEKSDPGAHRDEPAGTDIHGNDTVTLALFDAQGRHKPLRIDLDPLCDSPFMEGVEQDMAGDVGGIAGPGVAGAAKGALGDGPVGEPAERAPPVLHFIDDPCRLSALEFHGILVGQVITALDRIEGVLFPGIIAAFGVVGQGGVNPSLGSDRVGADRVDLRNQPHVILVAQADRRPEPRQTTTDNEDIVIKHAYENLK